MESIMASNPELIDHATLAHLVDAGAVRAANVVGQAGGWGIVVRYGPANTTRALGAKRGAVRIFRKFETLAGYLSGLGIVRYEVDASQYGPADLVSARRREDSADRLKHAHSAAAYDREFRDGVDASIADPRPSVSHDQVADRWATKRALLQAAVVNGADAA